MKTRTAIELPGLAAPVVAEPAPKPKPLGWTHLELTAAVVAYDRMLYKQCNGEPYNKKAVYRALAGAWERSEKSFEYRMQNISYVYSLMGRNWVKGLKPAKNVGRKVVEQLRAIILEVAP